MAGWSVWFGLVCLFLLFVLIKYHLLGYICMVLKRMRIFFSLIRYLLHHWPFFYIICLLVFFPSSTMAWSSSSSSLSLSIVCYCHHHRHHWVVFPETLNFFSHPSLNGNDVSTLFKVENLFRIFFSLSLFQILYLTIENPILSFFPSVLNDDSSNEKKYSIYWIHFWNELKFFFC